MPGGVAPVDGMGEIRHRKHFLSAAQGATNLYGAPSSIYSRLVFTVVQQRLGHRERRRYKVDYVAGIVIWRETNGSLKTFVQKLNPNYSHNQ